AALACRGDRSASGGPFGHWHSKYWGEMRNRQASLGKIVSVSNTLLARLLILLVVVCFSHTLHAQTITWAGRPWKVTGGGMAGVARGNPENVSVDEKGYLHVRIEKRDGKWTASELFTAERFGFGTYQWEVEGN